MTGPVGALPRNIAREVAQATESPGGWEKLEQLMHPAVMPDPFRPDDAMMMELAKFGTTEVGSGVIAWLRSISDLAPYPHVTAGGIEQAALAAARHEGRAHVGHLMAKAIAEGQRLNQLKQEGSTR
jgi:hypothetical protein